MSIRSEETAARPLATTLLIASGLVVVMMTAFLVGATGVMMREDLGFGATGLGLAVSTYFTVFALSSAVGGRLGERIGGGRALASCAVASAVVLLAIAGLANTLIHLLILMAIGGIIQGIAEPATNLAMARAVAQRPALMFGIKQAAVPVVTLLAGASVPIIALTVGWRWSFVATAGAALVVAVAMPKGLAPPRAVVARGPTRRHGDAPLGPLIALSIAAGAGVAPAVALGSFIVEAGAVSGLALGTAGWLMVAGSVAGIIARLIAGWLGDKPGSRVFVMISLMMLAGAVGFMMLATARPTPVVIGTLLAFGGGWGWLGLLFYAVARLNPNAPGAASGIVITGAAAGAGFGPVVFGLLVERGGFELAWTLSAAASVLSAVLIGVARRRLTAAG